MITSVSTAVWPTWYFTSRHLAMKRWTCSKHGAKAEYKCNVQADKCKVEELMHRLSPPRLTSLPHNGRTPWEPISGPSPDMRNPEQEEHRPQACHSRQRHHRPSSTQAPSLPQASPPSLLGSQTESHTKHCQVLDFFPHTMPCSHMGSAPGMLCQHQQVLLQYDTQLHD